MTRLRRFAPTLVAAAISALLAISLLGGCGDDKPADTGPGSGPQDEGG